MPELPKSCCRKQLREAQSKQSGDLHGGKGTLQVCIFPKSAGFVQGTGRRHLIPIKDAQRSALFDVEVDQPVRITIDTAAKADSK